MSTLFITNGEGNTTIKQNKNDKLKENAGKHVKWKTSREWVEMNGHTLTIIKEYENIY